MLTQIKVDQSIHFSCTNIFFTAFVLCSLILLELRGPNYMNRKARNKVNPLTPGAFCKKHVGHFGSFQAGFRPN